jgi:hypothetical protein
MNYYALSLACAWFRYVYWKPATCSPDCSAPHVPILHQDFSCLSSTTHACAGYYNSRTRWSSVFRPSGGLRFLPVLCWGLRENAWPLACNGSHGAQAKKMARTAGGVGSRGRAGFHPAHVPTSWLGRRARDGCPASPHAAAPHGLQRTCTGAALPRGRRGPPFPVVSRPGLGAVWYGSSRQAAGFACVACPRARGGDAGLGWGLLSAACMGGALSDD